MRLAALYAQEDEPVPRLKPGPHFARSVVAR